MSYGQTMKHWHNHRKQRFTQPVGHGFAIKPPAPVLKSNLSPTPPEGAQSGKEKL